MYTKSQTRLPILIGLEFQSNKEINVFFYLLINIFFILRLPKAKTQQIISVVFDVISDTFDAFGSVPVFSVWSLSIIIIYLVYLI